MKDVIQSMWISKPDVPLTTMEKLCMKSFMANGHEFHLYLYSPVAGVPDGVVLKDANDIVPRTTIKLFNYLAQFSDLFRYNLVYQRGGWWVDMDIVCLRPFEFEQETVISGAHGCLHNSPFKAPKGSPWLKYALELIDRKDDWRHLDWAAIGGGLLSEAAREVPIPVVNQFLFDPFQNSGGYRRYVSPDLILPTDFHEAYSVHLHHACWTLGLGGQPSLDPDATYPPNSLYEQLKRRYQI